MEIVWQEPARAKPQTKIPMILASHSLASNCDWRLDEKFLRKLVRMWRWLEMQKKMRQPKLPQK